MEAGGEEDHGQVPVLRRRTLDAGRADLCRCEVQTRFDVHHWLGPERGQRVGLTVTSRRPLGVWLAITSLPLCPSGIPSGRVHLDV